MGSGRTKPGMVRARDAIRARRQRVAELRLAGVRTLADLVAALEKEGFVKPDGSAWTKSTIHQDLDALRREWRERAAEDFDSWVAGETAQIEQARAKAWELAAEPGTAATGIGLVLKAHDRLSRLLGLQAPTRFDVTATAQPALDPEILSQADALLTRIATRERERGRLEGRGETLSLPSKPGDSNPDGGNEEAGANPGASEQARKPSGQAEDRSAKPTPDPTPTPPRTWAEQKALDLRAIREGGKQ